MENSFDSQESGIAADDVHRYIEEQIYTLPGMHSAKDLATVLLSGSRATKTHTPTSDVDIEVLCPQPVYDELHSVALQAGIITSPKSFFVKRPETNWERYFGSEKGRTHFSVTALDQVSGHFDGYRDVWMWVWTNAKIIKDPSGQFQSIVESFEGYPQDILVKKLKYHWLLAGYWALDVYPLSSQENDTLLSASAGLLNSVAEHLKVCFLAEGKPFPYTEKLMRLAPYTRLGKTIVPMLQRAVDLVVGKEKSERELWERLEQAFEILTCYDVSEENRKIDDACAEALKAAGVCANWVEADYDNIDELLLGELGTAPD